MATEMTLCRECDGPTPVVSGYDGRRLCVPCFRKLYKAIQAAEEAKFRARPEPKGGRVIIRVDHFAQEVKVSEDLFVRPSFSTEHVGSEAPETGVPPTPSAPPPIDDADGTLTVSLAGREPVALDLFVAEDYFRAALDGWRYEKGDGPAERMGAMKEYYVRLQGACGELGLGAVTGTTAERVRQAVAARMEDLRKKAGGGSPAPTP